MNQLMEVLNKRIDEIIEERKKLEKFIQQDKDLEEELHHFLAILEKYKERQISDIEISHATQPDSASEEVILDNKPTVSQSHHRERVRHSPGEAERHIIQILSKGETHSTASLVKRLKEVFDIDYSDSTVGVTLRRGERQGKFKRDGYQWSIV